MLLLADVLENFRSMCLEIYGLDPAKYISVPGLTFHTTLKMTKVELDLSTDINILVMIKKGIRGGKRNAVHPYAKLIINICVIMMKTKNHLILIIGT